MEKTPLIEIYNNCISGQYKNVRIELFRKDSKTSEDETLYVFYIKKLIRLKEAGKKPNPSNEFRVYHIRPHSKYAVMFTRLILSETAASFMQAMLKEKEHIKIPLKIK